MTRHSLVCETKTRRVPDAATAAVAVLLLFLFFHLTAEQRLPMGHCLEISSLYRNTDAIDVVDMVVVVISAECKIDDRDTSPSEAREIIYRIIRSDPQELEPISAVILSS